MTLKEVRQKFQDFYTQRDHAWIPSAPLVPENDPTTLFTGSGMQPLVPYLLGEKHPQGQRLANSQKSFRAEDIEEVGDNRHTTFFEMLGNWSLGDYFKEEQLPWLFEFLTDGLGFDPKRLYVTVFAGAPEFDVPRDEVSAQIWKKLFTGKGIEAREVELITEERGAEIGMQGGRIFYYGNKNWWSRAGAPENMPVGEPGGPDSELFYDFGEDLHDPSFGQFCHPNCDCGRFLELGNSVFLKYRKTETGFEKLAQQNVDFGGGLERMAAALIGTSDIFKVDALWAVIESLQSNFGKDYESDPETRRLYRIISDHIRGAVFMLGDGVLPSNKERGYILRRLLRRAYLQAYQSDVRDFDWVEDAARTVIESYRDSYPELGKSEARIYEELKGEAVKFYGTLEEGLKVFGSFIVEGKDQITGEEAFLLYATHGFPLELTVEQAQKEGLSVNIAEFEAKMKEHEDLSRTASAGTYKGGLADHNEQTVRLHTATHLMQAALRKYLGEHVEQRGSQITPDRTRFDFTHPEKMTPEQIQQVEEWVNEQINRGLEVRREEMSAEEARDLGAIGLFNEKYGDVVSVYTVLDPQNGEVISREFCGGPHVQNTKEIGAFKIKKEESSSAGIRRIKAIIE